jgi:hypothetical protein
MYIGQSPSIGNFQVCDAISVVNGQAAYTMQVSSVNVVPETANHMIVSLNGVIQAPGSSYTVAGSTITFASNLATGDVIDFIHILGSVLDLGVPSDDTVSTAKISANAVTAAKFNADVISGQTALATAPADTDEFLVSDAGVLKRIDYSLIKGGGMYEFISSTDVTSGVAQVDFTSFSTDYSDFHLVIQNIVTTTDAQELKLRFFNNAGSIVDGSSYQWSFHGADTGSIQNDSNGSNTDHAQLGRAIGNASRESANYEITMYDVHFTDDWRQFKFSQVYPNAAGEFGFQNGGGFSKYNNSDNFSISGVRIFWNSGNIASGRFSLYGRKHS